MKKKINPLHNQKCFPFDTLHDANNYRAHCVSQCNNKTHTFIHAITCNCAVSKCAKSQLKSTDSLLFSQHLQRNIRINLTFVKYSIVDTLIVNQIPNKHHIIS